MSPASRMRSRKNVKDSREVREFAVLHVRHSRSNICIHNGQMLWEMKRWQNLLLRYLICAEKHNDDRTCYYTTPFNPHHNTVRLCSNQDAVYHFH